MTQLTSHYFDAKKAGQLVYYFLHRADQQTVRITVPQMAAWLYLAERASYETLGAPLTGDQLVSTRQGPALAALAATLEHLQEGDGHFLQGIAQSSSAPCAEGIECTSPCAYSSIDELGRFSDAEVEILDDIWSIYGRWSTEQLQQQAIDVHVFPEWSPLDSDTPTGIELEELLRAVGFEEVHIKHLVDTIVGFGPLNAWQSPTIA